MLMNPASTTKRHALTSGAKSTLPPWVADNPLAQDNAEEK